MSRFYQFCCLLFLLVVGKMTIFTQTTIFNVPSTDIVPDKFFYFEADFSAHFDKLKNGGFQTYGYKTIYGLNRKVEVGANFFYTRNALMTAPKEFQANLKWKMYRQEKYGFAVTSGTQIFVPLNKFAGTRTYPMFYANASQVVKQAKGLRVTGGVYTMAGVKRDFGTKKGFILGFEQPVSPKLNFIGDWYSGKNRFGYSVAGLSYAVTKKQYLYLGYNFGNSGRANNAFSAFYGITY